MLIDEIKIKENLVYDKHATKIFGFVDIEDVGNQLTQLECLYRSESATLCPSIATQTLVLMVRGTYLLPHGISLRKFSHTPLHPLCSIIPFFNYVGGHRASRRTVVYSNCHMGDGASTNGKLF